MGFENGVGAFGGALPLDPASLILLGILGAGLLVLVGLSCTGREPPPEPRSMRDIQTRPGGSVRPGPRTSDRPTPPGSEPPRSPPPA